MTVNDNKKMRNTPTWREALTGTGTPTYPHGGRPSLELEHPHTHMEGGPHWNTHMEGGPHWNWNTHMEGGPHWNWNTHIQLAWILPQKKNDQSTLEIKPRQRVSHCPLFFNADFPLHFQDHNLSALVVTDVCLRKANDVNVMDLCQ